MPLTLPTALDAAVKFEVTTLCHVMAITRQDGIMLKITDADFDIRIGDDVYRSDVGFTASALMVGVNLNQIQGFTLTVGVTDDGFAADDLKARRYDSATVVYSECDFTQPADSLLVVFKGIIGRSSLTDVDKAEIEVLPLTDDQVQFADQVYSQTCRASLGDTQCGFPIEQFAFNFTVVEGGSRTVFTPDTFGNTAPAKPDIDTFAQGQLKWLTGANALWASDILASVTATKVVTLFFPVPEIIQPGDTGRMYPGCDRQLSTCNTKFANTVNFRGEPFAPQWG